MIKKKKHINTIAILVLLLTFGSCTKVVLKIDKLPPNTPPGASVYVSGNFNYWDAGDRKYQLTMNNDSTYSIQLPFIIGDINYKFTRGDWSTVEKDLCGNEVKDRLITQRQDTIYHTIESWADLDPVNCDSITIVIKNIPKTTPENEVIKIAGSFNAWNPGENPEYIAKKDTTKNQLKVTVPRKAIEGKARSELQYKFVRNNETVSEVDKFGREFDARTLSFEKGDTVFVEIEKWEDQVTPEENLVTIILTKIPSTTPNLDKIFLTGNFNDWNPRDYDYMFKKKNGQLTLSIPRKKYGLAFKITRGSWDTEFTDACGNILENQSYNYDEIDTLYYAIENWRDQKIKQSRNVTIILNKVPENTPQNETLNIRCFDFDLTYEVPNYPLKKLNTGEYIVTLPRRKINNRFVVTRESENSQQVDSRGNFIIDQSLMNKCTDTIHMEIDGWSDLYKPEDKITIELKIPKPTSKNDKVYIVGLFNGWNPGDDRYKLETVSDRLHRIEIPKHYLKGGFKFTRGSWNTVETKNFNVFVENRYYYGDKTLLKLEVKDWEDR